MVYTAAAPVIKMVFNAGGGCCKGGGSKQQAGLQFLSLGAGRNKGPVEISAL